MDVAMVAYIYSNLYAMYVDMIVYIVSYTLWT